MTEPSPSSQPRHGEKADDAGLLAPVGGITHPPVEAPTAPALPVTASAAPAPTAEAAVPAPLPEAPQTTTTERTIRGVLLALLVIPVGATLWVILWNLGFIASIVSLGTAWGAVRLYRIGSGGSPVTRRVFWALIGIIIVAVVASILAAIGSDVISIMGAPNGFEALTSGYFWPLYWENIFNNPAMWASYAPDIGMSVLFAGLGCFGTVRQLARESRA